MAYKIEPVIHSFDEMKRKWDRDNPDMPLDRDWETFRSCNSAFTLVAVMS